VSRGNGVGPAMGQRLVQGFRDAHRRRRPGARVCHARTGGVEALFWLDGEPAGLFNFDPWVKNRGDHRAQLVAVRPEAGQRLELAFEAYAGHPFEGTQPFDSIHNQGQYPIPFTRRSAGWPCATGTSTSSSSCSICAR
jgi:hypothetical protein